MTLGIKERVPLSAYTTFRIGGPAHYFIEVSSVEELREAIAFASSKALPVFILGGGSNMLVPDEGYKGLVIRICLKGIETREESDDVYLGVASGEVLDSVIAHCVENNWWGIENLSLIPGFFGAVPIQNVGAYGQQANDVITSIECFDRKTNEIVTLSNREAKFGYRASIFNTTEAGRYVILRTEIKLRKNGVPITTYPDVKSYFEKKRQTETPTIRHMREAITTIRQAKLPDPKLIGNAGSFFKNVYVTRDGYRALIRRLSTILNSEAVASLEAKIKTISRSGEDKIKIPTAAIIDLCGLKGERVGGAALHQKQPLVIINESGGATAKDVLSLFELIKTKIFRLTGLTLTREPVLME